MELTTLIYILRLILQRSLLIVPKNKGSLLNLADSRRKKKALIQISFSTRVCKFVILDCSILIRKKNVVC